MILVASRSRATRIRRAELPIRRDSPITRSDDPSHSYCTIEYSASDDSAMLLKKVVVGSAGEFDDASAERISGLMSTAGLCSLDGLFQCYGRRLCGSVELDSQDDFVPQNFKPRR